MKDVKEKYLKILEKFIIDALKSGWNLENLLNYKLTNFLFECELPNARAFGREFRLSDVDFHELVKKMIKDGKITETSVKSIDGGSILTKVDSNGAIAISGIDHVDIDNNNPNNEAKYDKNEINFVKIINIDYQKININDVNQKKIISFIINDLPNANEYEIKIDDKGNLTNVVRKINEPEKPLKLFEIAPIGNETGINNKKVKSNGNSTLPKNDDKGFTNVLILAFVIGSFFGVIFLALYNNIMH